ncbi:hypothetical protein [Microbacterium sp. NPDC097977]|uniref:hypothetical protein n=1 Tax=Microbacterium sp. NPDC097977 TaxID=3155686 RepID=UPI00332FA046
MKIRAALVAAIAALLLTGCSSTPAAESSPTESAPTAVVSEDSTVAQWASLIARQKASWEDWETGWNENSCSGLVAGSESGFLCRVQMMSAMYQSQTTDIEYQLATGPGKKGFIAEQPPQEISALFADTRQAAVEARDAGAAWDAAGCSATAAGDCGALAVTFDRAIGDLMSEFDAWGPYL